MKELNKAKTVVEYYVMCNKLKDVIRTGWKDWNVKRERLESIAEHIYGVQMLAIAMYSQYEYDIDIFKVIFMLAIHELEEIKIGDLTCFQISKENKSELGHKAVEEILKDMLTKEQIKALILEFDEGKTKEARFAYHCDKLECNLQCKLYDEENCVDLNNQENNKTYNDERVQELLIQENNSWSSMWLEFDRSKYEDDINFMEVLDYIKNNNINEDN